MSASEKIRFGIHCLLLFGLSSLAFPAEVSPLETSRRTISGDHEQFRVYANADAPGFDYHQVDPPSLSDCQSRCAEDVKCRAFTYNTAKKVCFLKHKASARLKFNTRAVTGKKSGAKNFTIRKRRDIGRARGRLSVLVASIHALHPYPHGSHDLPRVDPLEIGEAMSEEFFFDFLFIDHGIFPPRTRVYKAAHYNTRMSDPLDWRKND